MGVYCGYAQTTATQPAASQVAAPQTDPPKPMNLPTKVDLPPVPEKPKLTPEQAKMDTQLLELVKAHSAGGTAAAGQYAKDHALALDGNRIKLKIILLTAKDRKDIRKQIGVLKGKVATSFQNNLYALIPVESVTKLAEDKRVAQLSLDVTVLKPMPVPSPK
jgi:hypothetical protein